MEQVKQKIQQNVKSTILGTSKFIKAGKSSVPVYIKEEDIYIFFILRLHRFMELDVVGPVENIPFTD